MNINDIWNFELKKGNGHDPKDGACVMDAVSWFEYGTLGDHPACTCPVIAAYCRNANDTMTNAGRQKLKAFIPRLVGTLDPDSEKARCEYLVWQAIRVFTPLCLDKAKMHEEAKEVRNFSGTINEALELLKAVQKKAANAYAYAAAAAAANAAAANAAANAAAANAAANAAAANAAANAANAANAAADCSEWEPLLLAALDGVLKIGKQAEPIEPARFAIANALFAKARETA